MSGPSAAARADKLYPSVKYEMHVQTYLMATQLGDADYREGVDSGEIS